MNGLTEMTDFFQEYRKLTLQDCEADSPPGAAHLPSHPPPHHCSLYQTDLDFLTFKHTLSPPPQASAELCLALPPSPCRCHLPLT